MARICILERGLFQISLVLYHIRRFFSRLHLLAKFLLTTSDTARPIVPILPRHPTKPKSTSKSPDHGLSLPTNHGPGAFSNAPRHAHVVPGSISSRSRPSAPILPPPRASRRPGGAGREMVFRRTGTGGGRRSARLGWRPGGCMLLRARAYY